MEALIVKKLVGIVDLCSNLELTSAFSDDLSISEMMERIPYHIRIRFMPKRIRTDYCVEEQCELVFEELKEKRVPYLSLDVANKNAMKFLDCTLEGDCFKCGKEGTAKATRLFVLPSVLLVKPKHDVIGGGWARNISYMMGSRLWKPYFFFCTLPDDDTLHCMEPEQYSTTTSTKLFAIILEEEDGNWEE
ncbi:hypothetical protein CAEBREN_07516 [Caenorhabditis brenneri]|uniref:Uncharacterized protein n=1 Tax=Caenorhabditis brenneri TaxID=135651 RepID=G0P9E3_CAEBE|nr:hypothetical protein CAEBREN_07516 [Caenorhabditis brenneri]